MTPKRESWFRCGLGWLLPVALFLSSTSWSEDRETESVVVGIMPVYNSSGEAFAEEFAQRLTLMLFEEVNAGGKVTPKLLNPGGVYTPQADDWIHDFGQESLADAVLIPTLLESERPKSGDAILQLQLEMLPLSKGARTSPIVVTHSISKRTLDAGWEGMNYGSTSARPVDQRPLGKAARDLAKAASSRVPDLAQGVAAQQASPPMAATGATCSIDLAVLYKAKGTASKSYTLVVNHLDQTLQIHDGIAHFPLTSGPVLLEVAVKDAPYKLPVQAIYQANENADCAKHTRKLVMAIGSAGEATLHWE